MRGARGDVFLLGNRDLTLAELAHVALRALGRERAVVEVPAFAAHAAASLALARLTRRAPLLTPAAARIADLGLAADCSHAISKLDLPCTPIERAVADSLAWFGSNGYLRPSSRASGRMELERHAVHAVA